MPKKSENRETEIIEFIKNHPKCTSQEILDGLNLDISVATLRRKLQELVAEDLINAIGELKSRKYEISNGYNIIRPIDVDQYFEKEIDEREIKDAFNFNLIKETLNNVLIFTEEEIEKFRSLIDKNFRTEHSLQSYANQVGVTVGQLSRLYLIGRSRSCNICR